MNYFEIVVRGSLDKNIRKHLESYFYRKFKEAEKREFFEADEFFNGCLGIVKNLEGRIKRKVNDWRNTLELELDKSKNGLLQYKDIEGKAVEQKRQKTIEFCEQELASLNENDFYLLFPKITKGRPSGYIYKKDLLQIKFAIEKAFQKCENNAQASQERIKTERQNESQTMRVINETFDEMDNNLGWKYAFRSESDYNSFATLLTNFFELKEYQLPKQVIPLKKDCKTRLAATLGKIHTELSNEDKLIKDTKFFEIVRTLNHFESLTPEQLYKDLTRFGKY